MKPDFAARLFAVPVVTLMLASPAIADDVPYLEQARALCAGKLGVDPSELMDTSSRQGQLPLSGVTLNLHKFASIETADTCSAALGATGDEVDEAKLIAKEAKLRLEAYGAMDPDMFAHVSALPPATMLTVYVALTPPASIPDFREKESPYEAKKELTPMYTDTFADQVRNAFPDSNASAVSAAFAVTARLTADQTLAIARWSGVARVSGDIVTQDLSSAPAWYDTLRLSDVERPVKSTSTFASFQALPPSLKQTRPRSKRLARRLITLMFAGRAAWS